MAATRSNPKIVVSYRRSDSAMAGRIFDRLEQRFGKTSLFIDIDNIPYGVDFRQQIEEALKSSDLLVAIVGATWRGARDGGAARIMSEDDPVRVEIETAFARKIKVLPVLLDNAKMPEPQDLPDSIKNFAYLNAVEVESGRDFKFHADRLIGAVENSLGLAPTHGLRPGRGPSSRLIAGGLLAVLLVTALWLWLGRDRPSSGTATQLANPGFCDALNRVIAEARTQFTSILGPLSDGLWLARVQLPSWDNCRIRDWTYAGKTTRYYSCSLPYFANADAINARLLTARTDVKTCLGPDWIEQRLSRENQQVAITYVAGQGYPIPGLRVGYSEDAKDWSLSITVDAPGS